MARRNPARMRSHAQQRWSAHRLWGEHFSGTVWDLSASLPVWLR